MVETKKAETKAAPTKATEVPKARQNTVYDVPADKQPKPTEAEKEAAKAAEESKKVAAEAAEKAGRINSNLIKDGDSRRIEGSARDGKPVFRWGNFVPTQVLSDEELAAVEKMK